MGGEILFFPPSSLTAPTAIPVILPGTAAPATIPVAVPAVPVAILVAQLAFEPLDFGLLFLDGGIAFTERLFELSDLRLLPVQVFVELFVASSTCRLRPPPPTSRAPGHSRP